MNSRTNDSAKNRNPRNKKRSRYSNPENQTGNQTQKATLKTMTTNDEFKVNALGLVSGNS